MNIVDIGLIALVIGVVSGIIFYMYKKRKTSSCFGCSCCSQKDQCDEFSKK